MKAKRTQRVKRSRGLVEPTSARASIRPAKAATRPPRSAEAPAPQTAPSIAAAGLRGIVRPVGQAAASQDFSEPDGEGTGAGLTGPGPDGRGGLGFDWPALDAEREASHGAFPTMALVAQMLRDTLRAGPRYPGMSSGQKVAAEEIALKLARIVCGDPSFLGHWDDIIGYAIKGRVG